MLIHCTKKLLNELKVESSQATEENSLFSWHANLIIVNRRKTIVLMNDSNRYAIVLHGLKAKDFKKLDELILQAISKTFSSEGIKEAVIEAYIPQSTKISFTTTKNRTFVARLNKLCEHVYHYDSEFNLITINQPLINKNISRAIVSNGKNDYIRPNECLYKDLGNLTSGPIFQSEALILHVKLCLQNHNVWRKIIVPKNIHFPDLHNSLQTAFGWNDNHLHEFLIYAGRPFDLDNIKHVEKRQPIVKLVCDEEAFSYDSGIPMKMETSESLQDYIPAEIIYNYDFGDGWQHSIIVENVINNFDVNHSICVAGEGNTPPEDVGGEMGYEEFIAMMEDPTHPDYHHIRRWGIQQGYQDFDIEMVNRRLKYL